MKSLVIYDSLYGNTGKIARAIAEGLESKAVLFSEVQPVDLKNIELVVIGSPTHGGCATPDLTEFLIELPVGLLKNSKIAVFDTRFLEKDLNFALELLVRTIGYAAPKMAKLLEPKDGKLIMPPEGFIVKGKEGPLAHGELERAHNWLNLKNI